MELCETAILESIKSSDKQYYINSTTVARDRNSFASRNQSQQTTLPSVSTVHNYKPVQEKLESSFNPITKSDLFRSAASDLRTRVDPLQRGQRDFPRQVDAHSSVSSDSVKQREVCRSTACVSATSTESSEGRSNVNSIGLSNNVINFPPSLTQDIVTISNQQNHPVPCSTVATECENIRDQGVIEYEEHHESVVKGSPDQCVDIGFNFSTTLPRLVYTASSAFSDNCTKGCLWFPTGDKILVAAEDARYRIFELDHHAAEDPSPSQTIKETEMIYDFCWTGESNPTFLSTGRYQPVHLWDGGSGELLATYRCINHLDELAHSFCVCMSPCGGQFLTGLKNQIRRFDLSRPGRDCNIISTGNKSGDGQTGIISCISVNRDHRMIAAGSYSRSVGLYSEDGALINLLFGHTGGVTQVSFSPDLRRVYSGARKDDQILCWDLRNQVRPLHILKREAKTNQRFQFSFCGDDVLSGGSDGCLRVWDSLGQVRSGYLLHPDSVPGLSVHPTKSLVATSSGQRHAQSIGDENLDLLTENSLKIWSFSLEK